MLTLIEATHTSRMPGVSTASLHIDSADAEGPLLCHQTQVLHTSLYALGKRADFKLIKRTNMATLKLKAISMQGLLTQTLSQV